MSDSKAETSAERVRYERRSKVREGYKERRSQEEQYHQESHQDQRSQRRRKVTRQPRKVIYLYVQTQGMPSSSNSSTLTGSAKMPIDNNVTVLRIVILTLLLTRLIFDS